MPDPLGIKYKMSAAELYDLRTSEIVADRVAIENLVGGLRTLEVGCGTGRILKWLVGKGADYIVGIDHDKEKLEVALHKSALFEAKELTLKKASFLAFRTDRRFECVLFAFNVLSEFIDVDKRIEAVRQALGLLDCDGKIVIITSVHDFDSYSHCEVSHEFEINSPIGIWDAKLLCRREQMRQLSKCKISYVCRSNGQAVTDEWRSSLVTRNELIAIYRAAGVSNITEFGSYELTPITSESKVLIHVLRAG